MAKSCARSWHDWGSLAGYYEVARRPGHQELLPSLALPAGDPRPARRGLPPQGRTQQCAERPGLRPRDRRAGRWPMALEIRNRPRRPSRHDGRRVAFVLPSGARARCISAVDEALRFNGWMARARDPVGAGSRLEQAPQPALLPRVEWRVHDRRIKCGRLPQHGLPVREELERMPAVIGADATGTDAPERQARHHAPPNRTSARSWLAILHR